MSAELRGRIDAFLAAHTTLTLATVNPDGTPAAAAVFYAHDADLSLVFLSEARTGHSTNLGTNPAVAGTIQDDGQDWRTIRGLQVQGSAAEVPTGQLPRVVALYVRKYAFLDAFLAGASGALSGPLERARFYVLRPRRFRLIDNRVRFGFKEELLVSPA